MDGREAKQVNLTGIYPMKMQPALKSYLWGGTQLRESFGKSIKGLLRDGQAGSSLAESWEVSTHPAGLSVIANGMYTGQTLKSVTGKLPVLIKLIDAHLPLSLQVHPGDEYARSVEGHSESGKNEMWYIMSAGPGAELILGFNECYSRDELEKIIDDGEILSAVRRIPVEAGDCYYIPAGMLHSIGGDIVVAEVQQPSNLTYRIYDYGRVDGEGKPRQLHIDKALDVLDASFEAEKIDLSGQVDFGCFKCRLLEVGAQVRRGNSGDSFECLLVTDAGSDNLLRLVYAGGEIALCRGESVFIPTGMGMGEYTLEGATGGKVLAVTV